MGRDPYFHDLPAPGEKARGLKGAEIELRRLNAQVKRLNEEAKVASEALGKCNERFWFLVMAEWGDRELRIEFDADWDHGKLIVEEFDGDGEQVFVIESETNEDIVAAIDAAIAKSKGES